MLLGFDTETFPFRPGLPAPRMVCGSFSDGTRDRITLPEDTRAQFVTALERGDHLTGVNHAFDIGVMVAYDPSLLPLIFEAGDAGLLHCSGVREALHDTAIDKLFIDYKTGEKFSKGEDFGGRYSMVILMERHFGLDISSEKVGDVWRLRYAELDGVPLNEWPQAAIDYPKSDARRHWQIHQAQINHRNLHDEAAQVRASIALQLMRMWGFRTDPAYIEALEKDVDAAWDEAQVYFKKQGIFRADGSKDTAALRERVTKAYDGKPPMTKGGKKSPPAVSTDRDTLVESGDPDLEKLGTGGKNNKRKTTYIPALKAGIYVPITPETNVLVNTGRLSCDWQQMPQKGGIREAVIARPGFLFSSNDFGGLELRTMAERAILDPDVRFSKLADMLNGTTDVHCYVGAGFLGITYDEFVSRKVELKPFRDVAKMFNFGAGGGAGAFAIAYNAKTKDNIRLCLSLNRAKVCGVTKIDGVVGGKAKRVCALCVQIAHELKAKWLKLLPEQGLLAAKASRLTAKGRKVDVTIFGSERVRGKCGFSQWLNTPFQGAGGDGCKDAMWEIDRRAYTDRKSPLWGSRVVLNVHDELITEHPEDRAHEAAFAAAEIMVSRMDRITKHVKNEVKPALMRRLFKNATDVYDRAGRLKAWWPSDWAWSPDAKIMALDKAA